MVKNYTIDYHPSPLQLLSRTHPLIFLWTPKGFISPECFLRFFLKLYIPSWLQKSFKFSVLRLLANTFVSKKIESVHFYSFLQAKLSSRFWSLYTPQAEGNYPFPLNSVFWRSIFYPAERGEYMEFKKLAKLNLEGYWLQVLINSTIFAAFTLLVSVAP